MEVIKNLLIRFRQSGVLLFIGFLVIIYISFGFVYWQQTMKQKDLKENNTNISNIVTKPLADKEQLKTNYDNANIALAPMTDSDAIAKLVKIAEKSGIDISPDSDNLIIPSAVPREEVVGEGNYKIWTFKNISVQGDYDSVMTFISDLDAGMTQQTIVLKRLTIDQFETTNVNEDFEEEIETEAKATLDVDIYTKLSGDGI